MILTNVVKKVHDFGTLVMFSHTIFSLSFALISIGIASNYQTPPFSTLLWTLVAILAARTGANALNRVIDAEIDGKNPRTAVRQLPQGQLKKREAIIFACLCFAIMLFAMAMINLMCLILSPIVLFLMIIYSYTKRFTWTCHVILGITCAAAPVGAWIAITGEFSWIAFLMGAANTAWVAGFDIIYGSQDYDFDTTNGLHSIPAQFGVKHGLYIAAIFHIGAVLFLIMIGMIGNQLGIIYFIGIGIISILFIIEHSMVSPTNLAHVKIASYSINQLVSIVFLVFGMIDIII